MKFSEFVAFLRNKDNKKSDKIKMITEMCRENPWFEEVLSATYTPFRNFYIGAKRYPEAPKDSSDKLETMANLDESTWRDVVVPLLEKLERRESDNKSLEKAISNAASLFPRDDQDILKCIILRDLRIGFAGKSINSAVGKNIIPVSRCQLCKTYDPESIIRNVDGWWASRKLNGLRGMYEDVGRGFELVTREEFPLKGFDAITSELSILQKVYDLELIDGEIFSLEIPFQTIMSIARGEKEVSPEQKQLLIFNVFNVQKKDMEWNTTKDMVYFIRAIFREGTYSFVRPLEYEWIENTREKIEETCRRYTSEGYEGIVIRDPIISWEAGKRNNHLLKYKLFNECDLVVREVLFGTEGKKWENQATALLCEGKVRARKFMVGDSVLFRPLSPGESQDDPECVDIDVVVEASLSTLTDKERDEFTKKKDEMIGRRVQINFQAFTDKPDENGRYSLQFPTFDKEKSMK